MFYKCVINVLYLILMKKCSDPKSPILVVFLYDRFLLNLCFYGSGTSPSCQSPPCYRNTCGGMLCKTSMKQKGTSIRSLLVSVIIQY